MNIQGYLLILKNKSDHRVVFFIVVSFPPFNRESVGMLMEIIQNQMADDGNVFFIKIFMQF